ncbi:hypothetical protein ACTWP4_00370 [Gracilibacillus sp. D59]|uniref:hypothetical protein n=1 Tax=Gracilibacillus sp. D59 TaxID=3457434 RepID=UPI003FCD7407
MNPVKVPKEVAEAFSYHEQQFRNMPKATLHFVLMGIPFSVVHGQALVLKQYANSHPTQYLQAVLHGYVYKLDTKQELANMIEEWLNTPYEGTSREEVQMLADKIVNHFQKQT